MMKRKQLLKIIIALLVSFFSGAGHSSPINELSTITLSDRDPFSPLLTTHCLSDQQASFHPLKNWQLLGIIGQSNKWRSWVADPQKQWLAFKEGDPLPNTDLLVSDISINFTKFASRSSVFSQCEALSTIQLNFDENNELSRKN